MIAAEIFCQNIMKLKKKDKLMLPFTVEYDIMYVKGRVKCSHGT